MRKILSLLILAMLMLSSCDNDPANKVTLSRRQLAQAIEGYYQGHYRVLWGDLGTGAAEEDSVGCVSMDVQDWDHRTVVFNDFPLHLITKVVGEESPLAEALRERPTVELLSYYSFLIPNDNSVDLYIKPQGFHITAPYEGVLPISSSPSRMPAVSMDCPGRNFRAKWRCEARMPSVCACSASRTTKGACSSRIPAREQARSSSTWISYQNSAQRLCG